jgi:hypothetical protein
MSAISMDLSPEVVNADQPDKQLVRGYLEAGVSLVPLMPPGIQHRLAFGHVSNVPSLVGHGHFSERKSNALQRIFL